MKLHFKNYSTCGEPLFILHGLFGSLTNWNWHSKQFSEQFSVYGVDLRNHGESPHDDTLNYDVMAQDVVHLFDDLGIESACIIGHSMGGKVAMELALRWPDYVNKLIVVDIAPVSYDHSHQSVFDGLKAVPLDAIQSRKDAEKEMAKHVKEPGVRQFLLKSLYQDENGDWKWRFNVDGLIASYSHIIDWEQTNQTFDGVTLFIKGSESDYITPAYRDEITRYFPKAKAHVIEGTGHWLHAEKPAVFNAVVERTLNKSS